MGHATVDPEVRGRGRSGGAASAAQALGVALERRHPAIGDTQAMFETLVALDTDRAGLKAHGARSRASTLDRLAGGLVERDWSGDEFSAALMERKRIVNTHLALHGGARLPAHADHRGAGLRASTSTGPTHIDGRPVAPTAWIAFSALANLTGLPAASVPIGFTADGRPIGLQITGRHLDDRGVLALASVRRSAVPAPALARAGALSRCRATVGQ